MRDVRRIIFSCVTGCADLSAVAGGEGGRRMRDCFENTVQGSGFSVQGFGLILASPSTPLPLYPFNPLPLLALRARLALMVNKR